MIFPQTYLSDNTHSCNQNSPLFILAHSHSFHGPPLIATSSTGNLPYLIFWPKWLSCTLSGPGVASYKSHVDNFLCEGREEKPYNHCWHILCLAFGGQMSSLAGRCFHDCNHDAIHNLYRFLSIIIRAIWVLKYLRINKEKVSCSSFAVPTHH